MLEFIGPRPGIYWATPWNLLGYALEPPIYCTVPSPEHPLALNTSPEALV